MWKKKAGGSLVAVALAAALTAACGGAEEPEPMMDPEAAAPLPTPDEPAAVAETEATLTGCLTEANGAYVMTLTEAAGDAAPGAKYALTLQEGVDVAGHVTHTVRLTGSVTSDPPVMNVTAMEHVSPTCEAPPPPGT